MFFKNPLKQLALGRVRELVFFAGVTAGAVVGAITGMAAGLACGGLTAAKSGEDMRHDLASKTGKITNEIGSIVKKTSNDLCSKASKIRTILTEDELA